MFSYNVCFLLHGRDYVPSINSLPFNWLSWLPAWAGVCIFLFLSGYGIGCGFFRNHYNLFNNSKISFKMFLKFYLGRFIKIAPIYYIYCISFEIISGQYYFWNNGAILLKMLTFTFNGIGGISGIGHLWYVSMAMQLYLFMPFIYLILKKIRANKYVLAVIFFIVTLAGLSMRVILYSKGYDWYSYSYTNCFMNLDFIIAGMIISRVKVCEGINLSKPYLVKSLVSIAFIILIIYNCQIYAVGSLHCLFIYQNILPAFYIICCSCLILTSNINDHYNRHSIVEWIVNKFSKYSYAFYILHIAVFNYLKSTLLASNWYLTLSIIERYTIFFGISFIIILILAIPLTAVSKEIALKYKIIEKKVFGS